MAFCGQWAGANWRETHDDGTTPTLHKELAGQLFGAHQRYTSAAISLEASLAPASAPALSPSTPPNHHLHHHTLTRILTLTTTLILTESSPSPSPSPFLLPAPLASRRRELRDRARDARPRAAGERVHGARARRDGERAPRAYGLLQPHAHQNIRANGRTNKLAMWNPNPLGIASENESWRPETRERHVNCHVS